jgi:hypothetical protein
MKTNAKRFVCLAVAATMLTSVSLSRAGVTGVINLGYGAGLDNFSSVFDSSPQLVIGADQTATGPVGVWGTILTDTAVDPTLTINDQLNNASGVDWSGFVLDVYMGSSFSLALPASPVANPLGWTGSITVVPYDTGGGTWMGQITYTGGTLVSADPLSANNLLDFTYKISFSGSTSYSFGEQGMAVTVPEPSSIMFVLMCMGALVGFRRLAQKRAI